MWARVKLAEYKVDTRGYEHEIDSDKRRLKAIEAEIERAESRFRELLADDEKP